MSTISQKHHRSISTLKHITDLDGHWTLFITRAKVTGQWRHRSSIIFGRWHSSRHIESCAIISLETDKA